jgi:TRAP-type C4-dicarboxylate transport system substrate-binding protein
MSDGRLTFELFTGGALVPSNEILPSCADGVFEVGSSAASYWKGTAPECLVTIFPQGYRTGDDQAAVMYNYGLLEFFQDTYADMGVHLLTMVQHGNINLLSKTPVREVGDFDGLMIRTHGSNALLVEQLGASTVYIPGEEIYTALQLGTVDAMTWGGPSTLYLNKWYEQAKYILLDPPLTGNFMNDDFYVNMAAWESLPDDLKAIFQYAASLAFFENGVTFRKGDDDAIALLKAEGVEFTTLSEEDKAIMTEAATVVWDDIASQSPRAKQAVKIITDLLRDRGYTDYKIE